MRATIALILALAIAQPAYAVGAVARPIVVQKPVPKPQPWEVVVFPPNVKVKKGR